jgi:hypothetical protein
MLSDWGSMTGTSNLPCLAFGEDLALHSFDARAMTEMISQSIPNINIIDPLLRDGEARGFLNKSCITSIGKLNILATASTPCLYDMGENIAEIQITIPIYGESEIHVDNKKYRINAHETGSILGHYQRAVGFNRNTNCLVFSPCPGALHQVARTMLNVNENNEDFLELIRTKELSLTSSGYSVSAYFLAISKLIDDLIDCPQVLDNIGVEDLIYRQLVLLLAPKKLTHQSLI